MNLIKTAAPLAAIALAGCASTPLSEKVTEWQDTRPYADKIKQVQSTGRALQSRDVDLVFTMDDFKKAAELPEAAANIEAILTVGKTALNVVAEIGNTTSPLYAAAVESVDKKWTMYVGRDLEVQAAMKTDGDVNKYIETLPKEVREAAHKDYDAYQKIVKNVPDPVILAQGKAVYERFLVTETAADGTEVKTLDVMGIEALPYKDAAGQADYSAFCLYRDNTPEVQDMCDNAMLNKLNAVLANVQAQMTDLLNSVSKLREDPEVAQLPPFDLLKTLKGVGVGIGTAFADPLAKLNGAISGYSLASDIDSLAKATQEVEQAEADKAKKD